MWADRTVKTRRPSVDLSGVQSSRTDDPAFVRALVAAQRGQAPGFEWLWNRFARQVVSFATAQGSEDGEGLTNEVFLGAFGRIAEFSGNEDGFVSLLFSIARNKVIDERRRRGRRVVTQQFSAADERSFGDVENDALASIGGEAASMLAVLTEEQREVLHLRLIADLSLEQTAHVTGKSVNAVKALQHRATQALRRNISEEAVTR